MARGAVIRAVIQFVTLITPLAAVSFDCRHAVRPVEKMVCRTPELAKLDDDLAIAYRRALSIRTLAERPRLVTSQKAALALRNECSEQDCVRDWYLDRIHVLRGEPSLPVAALAGEYGLGRFRPREDQSPETLERTGYNGSLFVHSRSAQVEISASSYIHGHTCGFGGTSTRREKNTFFFGEGPDAPSLTFYPASAALTITDTAASCGFGAHLDFTFQRVWRPQVAR